jgi:hypothetical protein
VPVPEKTGCIDRGVVEGAMTSIIPFVRQNVFDAETTRVMGEAYDAACGELGNGGTPALVKEVIAKRIIEAAKKGERDPQRLCAKALDALGMNGHPG